MSEDAENMAYEKLLQTEDRLHALQQWVKKQAANFKGR
jgi:hypothetical protein